MNMCDALEPTSRIHSTDMLCVLFDYVIISASACCGEGVGVEVCSAHA
jgi:hypothetical protein